MARQPAGAEVYREELRRAAVAAARSHGLETARLTSAIDAGDFHEYVAELRGRIARHDADAACLALDVLHENLTGTTNRDALLSTAHCNAFVEAGGMAAVLDAVQTSRSSHSGLFVCGCAAISALAEHARPDNDVNEVVAAALRLSLMEPLARSDALDNDNCNGALACLLCSPCCRGNMALHREALAAGAVERLLEGCAADGIWAEQRIEALSCMCCAGEDVRAECTARAAAGSGLDALLAAMAIPTQASTCVKLLNCLLQSQMAPVTAEKFRARETAIFKALLVVLAGPSRTSVDLATCVCVTLGLLMCPSWMAKDIQRPADRFGPRLVVAAVDGVLAAMRGEGALTQCHPQLKFPVLGTAAAAVLKLLMGSCGGTDTAAPGTYLLRAGALPLLEVALSVTEADLVSNRNEDAENCFNAIKDLVDQLRNLVARADAAAAELIAEEEAAARSAPVTKAKAGKARSKSKGGKAAKPSATKTAVQQPPTSAPSSPDAASSSDAATSPPPTAAQAPPAPPPLPPWLVAAMHRLPPPSAAPPAGLGTSTQQLLDRSGGDCVICLDAPAAVRTRCCAKQGPVFCAPCAALLAGVTRCALCGVDAAETATGAVAGR